MPGAAAVSPCTAVPRWPAATPCPAAFCAAAAPPCTASPCPASEGLSEQVAQSRRRCVLLLRSPSAAGWAASTSVGSGADAAGWSAAPTPGREAGAPNCSSWAAAPATGSKVGAADCSGWAAAPATGSEASAADCSELAAAPATGSEASVADRSDWAAASATGSEEGAADGVSSTLSSSSSAAIDPCLCAACNQEQERAQVKHQKQTNDSKRRSAGHQPAVLIKPITARNGLHVASLPSRLSHHLPVLHQVLHCTSQLLQ